MHLRSVTTPARQGSLISVVLVPPRALGRAARVPCGMHDRGGLAMARLF
jgi:hypothetical protein